MAISSAGGEWPVPISAPPRVIGGGTPDAPRYGVNTKWKAVCSSFKVLDKQDAMDMGAETTTRSCARTFGDRSSIA